MPVGLRVRTGNREAGVFLPQSIPAAVLGWAKERIITLEKFVIRGGNPLTGDVTIGGAKNAAVAILPATILAAGKCIIENLPCISDVMASLQILSELGASIRMISKSTY